MTRSRVLLLTLLAMLCFAGNSLLCRVALQSTRIDAATFTLVRVVAGALVLGAIVRLRGGSHLAGSWLSALALFAYAAGFSFAYVNLPAGTGALLLFSAVQGTMIGYGLWAGERPGLRKMIGFALALGGLLALVAPGLAAPPPGAASLMLGAGVAWGVYSLRGKGAGDPTETTAANFLRAVPMAAALSVGMISAASWDNANWDMAGACYAAASGALTSGVGYAIWYTALKGLKPTEAAAVQLSVPVLAMLGGILLLGETLTYRGLGASAAILGGIALVILDPRPAR